MNPSAALPRNGEGKPYLSNRHYFFNPDSENKNADCSQCYGEQSAYEIERALPDFTEFRARLCLLKRYLILLEKSRLFF